MTNLNSNKDLFDGDASLDKFGEPSYKTIVHSETNDEAFRLLLTTLEEEDSNDDKFVRRRDKKTKPSGKEIRQIAIEKRQHIRLAKLNYPYIWYGTRLTFELTKATIQETVAFLATFIFWWIYTPLDYVFNFVCEQQYNKFKKIVDEGTVSKVKELGRGRGHTFLDAFYARCVYGFLYFRVHQFYGLELFLKSSLTIRRALQVILPTSLICILVQRSTTSLNGLPTRGFEETSQTFQTNDCQNWEKLLLLETIHGPIRRLPNFLRDENGVLFTRRRGLKKEFVMGDYEFVEKTLTDHITHPMELLEVGPKEFDTTLPFHENIGYYVLSGHEESERPAPIEEDDEIIIPDYIPDSLYTRLKKKDSSILTRYKAYLHQTGNYCTEAFTARAQHISDLYMPLMPNQTHLPGIYPTEYEWIDEFTNTTQLPRYEAIEEVIVWDDEIAIADMIRDLILSNEKAKTQVFDDGKTTNGRLTFSRLGIDYQPENEASHSLKPFAAQGTKLFHYSISTNQEILEAVGLRLNATQHYETEQFHKAGLALEESFTDFTHLPVPETTSAEDDEFETNDVHDVDRETDDYEADNEANVNTAEEDNNGNDVDEEAEDDNDIDADDEDNGNDDEEDDEDDVDVEYDDEDEDAEYDEEDEDNGVDNDETDDNNNAHIRENNNFTGETNIQNEFKSEETTHSGDQLNTFDVEMPQNGTFSLPDDDSSMPENGIPNGPIWFPEGTLFLNPTQYEQWPDVAWRGIALQLIMYASMELCIRLNFKGVHLYSEQPEDVYDYIPHIGRMPEGVPTSEYVGEKMQTVSVKKLLLAFQAQRGAELYGASQWEKLWAFNIRPNLSDTQAKAVQQYIRKFRTKLLMSLGIYSTGTQVIPPRNLLEYVGLSPYGPSEIPQRYFYFDKLTNKIHEYIGTMESNGSPLLPESLQERQTIFNDVGGELAITRALQIGKSVQDEICKFPLFALIKPGTERMRTLPKGLILLGESGNGRNYFVRTLATEARLPMLITESNRYLNESLGLVRLKALFQRAREQAPNILFIRDMDFMTRHRERYPAFTSVRATTQLLLAMDGFTRGTEGIPSKQDIFVIGTMETTSMMDDACMRSGRFEWVLDFYYPPVNERHQMLVLHSTKSIINQSLDIDWRYFTALTEGFSCLDLRTLINTSRVYMFRQNETLHTSESMNFALAFVNQVHDLPETQFIDPVTLGFFSKSDYQLRHKQPTKYASFFTQTGRIPMYKKLMHLFRVMLPEHTDMITNRWANTNRFPSDTINEIVELNVADGLVPMLCEGLFIYNLQKSFGTYPIVTFETYCSPLFFTTQSLVDQITSQYGLERLTQANLLMTTFDLWRRAHPDTWTTTALHKTKLLDMRINGTATWKDNRFAKGNTNVGNLTETQCEMLWGPLQITEKIQSRLRFIGKKHNEFASTDLNVFGTFETNSDRAFKCRKETTAGRIDQVGMEIVDVMQKDWRKKGIPASIGK